VAKRGRPRGSGAGFVVVGEDGEELLSVAEAAKRSGIPEPTPYSRIQRGSLKVVKRVGTRIPASALAEKLAG
jgi:excisionase family DNA binding protein